MSYVSRSFQVLIVFLCFNFFLSGMQEDIPSNSKIECDSEVRQESQLCNLPVHVLHHIACFFCKKGYLSGEEQTTYARWKEINNFASTCRFLDSTVTAPGRRIRLCCWKKEKEDRSCGDLLSCVYNLLTRIVIRRGNNPIHLDLSGNELAGNMSEFKLFIEKCLTFKYAESSIVNQLTSLNLGLNGFIELPGDITRLRALKRLFICANPLNSATIEQICTMTSLENLDISYCNLQKLPAAFKNLRGLRILNLDRNPLTKEDLTLLESFSELRELHIGNNNLPNKDIIHSARYWKKIERLYPNRFRLDEDLSEEFQALPLNIKICG